MQRIPVHGLPDVLPPFDLALALSRINNNSQLLLKLLAMFVDTYTSTVPTLREHISQGRQGEAARLAHSLKGTSAILGAHELAAAASALEQLLKEGTTVESEDLIDELEKKLVPALTAADSLGRVLPQATLPSSAHDVLDLPALLSDLRMNITTNNIRARKIYAQISNSLLGRGMDDIVIEVGSRLDALDFSGALSSVDKLIHALAT